MNEQISLAKPDPAPQDNLASVKPKFIDLVKDTARNLYANKKVFWLLVGAATLIVIIIIAGLIFSLVKNRQKGNGAAVGPTPQVTQISTARQTNENETKLKSLKEEAVNLDLYQKRLTPPSVNFKIDF